MPHAPHQAWTAALGDDRAAETLWRTLGEADADGPGAREPDIDVDAAWRRLEARLPTEAPVVALRDRRRPPAPTHSPARRWPRVALAVAAAIALLIVANLLSGLGESRLHYVNDGATVLEVTLADDTRVALSPAGEVRFAQDATSRSASLRGKGTFTVVKDAARPFRVHAGALEVLVIGTAFEVESGDPARIAVVEGHVRVRGSREADWVDLYAGDGAEAQGGLLIQGPEPAAGTLRFRDAPLGDVVRALQAVHETAIALAPELAACAVTVDLEGLTLAESLRTLSLLTGARATSVPTGTRLEGGRCR